MIFIEHVQREFLPIGALSADEYKKSVESTLSFAHTLFASRFRYRFNKLLINVIKSVGEFGLDLFNIFNDISIFLADIKKFCAESIQHAVNLQVLKKFYSFFKLINNN